MPTQEEISDMLGRPLTAKEAAGFDAYIEIAVTQLGSILGYSLALSDTPTTKEFTGSRDYRSLIIPPFTDITEVKVNGEVETNYSVSNTSKPFNVEIVLPRYMSDSTKVAVTAKWGYSTYPSGVLLLLANMFSVVANGQTSEGSASVKSETVLSHSVTYETGVTRYEQFAKDNANIIELYRLPYSSLVSTGRILWSNDDDLSDYRPYF